MDPTPVVTSGMTSEALSSFLTNVGTVVTQAVSWCTDILSMVTGSPVLFTFFVLGLVGLGVGLLGRVKNL